jgi:hypothetical protein
MSAAIAGSGASTIPALTRKDVIRFINASRLFRVTETLAPIP